MGETFLGLGTVRIGDVEYKGLVTDFTYDEEGANERICDYIKANMQFGSATFSCTVKRSVLLKLMGIWDWVYENCPDRHVARLMKHGREKTKVKNFKHAIRLIIKKLEVVS